MKAVFLLLIFSFNLFASFGGDTIPNDIKSEISSDIEGNAFKGDGTGGDHEANGIHN